MPSVGEVYVTMLMFAHVTITHVGLAQDTLVVEPGTARNGFDSEIALVG